MPDGFPKRLRKDPDKLGLWEAFCHLTGYNIPSSYFLSADCYGIKHKGKYVGGFIIHQDILFRLRAFNEIPKDNLEKINIEKYIHTTADLTGYFITSKKHGFALTCCFVLSVMTHRAKHFIYSYDTDNKRLERYYGNGKPVRLYSGIPALIEGYSSPQPPVNVEILTKFGIFRIFLNRTLKMLR